LLRDLQKTPVTRMVVTVSEKYLDVVATETTSVVIVINL